MGTNNQLLYYQYSASAKQTKYFNVWRICYLLYINLVQEAVNRRRTEYNGIKTQYWYKTIFFLGNVSVQSQYKWIVYKLTFCDRQSDYIKEFRKHFSGLDTRIAC
jgi:hypothetical protein